VLDGHPEGHSGHGPGEQRRGEHPPDPPIDRVRPTARTLPSIRITSSQSTV
jgi:hypothetical protein